MNIFVNVCLLLSGLLIGGGLEARHFQGMPPVKRTYWRVTVDQLAQGVVKHTHVQVSGRVKLVRHEQDGDLHIQLTGLKGFIVAECIPRMPCDPPAVGSLVTVRGLSRFDGEHHWWEVHPVEQIAAGVVR